MERLRGMAAPNGAGPLAGGAWCPAEAAVIAHGAPMGHCSPKPNLRGTGTAAQAGVAAY